MPLIPARRQGNLSEFKANLVYRVTSRTANATHRSPVLKTKAKTKQNKRTFDTGLGKG